ncbi:MAG: trypsin-like peptidase domain-containing protein [Clostridia bacterium]|nr:trypsin-like peptidase domain-containing protein [Clostridia bacterium]
MKNTHRITILTLFILLIVSLSFVLSGCYAPSYKGVRDTYINEDGELIITYTNGDKENLGVVVGQDGKDGKDGQDGEDGEDGRDGSGSDVIINGSGQNISYATSKAARSAVSVVASYNDVLHGQFASSGSGVIYKYDKKADGYFIITNYHVVFDADCGISQEIHVLLYGNEYQEGIMDAEYVGGSLSYDIAVLFVKNNDIIKKSSAACVDVADSNTVSIGDVAIAVGNARGEGISATSGVISVDSETLEMTGADEKTAVKFRVMRTDASVNKGNSGGGLYNDKGELIGIVNAKIIVSGVEGIGYAIPSTLAVNIADNIIDNCFEQENTYVKRALLGITVSVSDSVSVYDAQTGKISIVETIYVVEASSTNLFGEDIKANDVIKSIKLDGHDELTVTRQFHVIDYLLQARLGDTGTLTVERENEMGEKETVTLNFTITENAFNTPTL